MSEIEKKEAEETETKKAHAADEEEVTEADSEGSEEATEEASEEAKKETPEAKLARLERQTKQLRKKLGMTDEKPEKTSKKSDGFDDAQLLLLELKGIDADEDIEWTQEQLKERGGNLRDLLGKKWFQAELKERKDDRTNREAISVTSKRSSSKPADIFERSYAEYQKTGKLPEDRAMQEKIIARRREAEGSGNKFTTRPVVGNW